MPHCKNYKKRKEKEMRRKAIALNKALTQLLKGTNKLIEQLGKTLSNIDWEKLKEMAEEEQEIK